MKTIECSTREAWLTARREFIGASESPAILGCGYAGQTPLTVYASKVCEPTDEPTDDRFVFGTLLEPALREIFRYKTGKSVVYSSPFTILRSEEISWLSASLDGVTESDGELVPVELKNVDYFQRDEWDDGGSPLKYQVQVQHQLAVTGVSHGYLMGLIGGNDPQIRRIERNDRFIAAMIDRLGDFWKCVQSRTPPHIDGSAASADAIKRLYPRDCGAVVDLPGDIVEWCKKMAEAKEQSRVAEAIWSEAENRIKAAIGEASYGRLPDGSGFSWKAQTAKYEAKPACEKTFRVLRSVKKIP